MHACRVRTAIDRQAQVHARALHATPSRRTGPGNKLRRSLSTLSEPCPACISSPQSPSSPHTANSAGVSTAASSNATDESVHGASIRIVGRNGVHVHADSMQNGEGLMMTTPASQQEEGVGSHHSSRSSSCSKGTARVLFSAEEKDHSPSSDCRGGDSQVALARVSGFQSPCDEQAQQQLGDQGGRALLKHTFQRLCVCIGARVCGLHHSQGYLQDTLATRLLLQFILDCCFPQMCHAFCCICRWP